MSPYTNIRIRETLNLWTYGDISNNNKKSFVMRHMSYDKRHMSKFYIILTFMIYTVLSRCQICHNLRVFSAKSVSPKIQGWQKNHFFQLCKSGEQQTVIPG